MKNPFFALPALFACLAFSASALHAQNAAPDTAPPHLEKRGAATQLIVDGKPFLMLSGELHNSSSSSLDYMKPIWDKLRALGLNSVVTPLSWELVEPQEGTFDYTLVDGLIQQARQENLRIVFLWLATWKNGLSSYTPVWVKQDTRRFPRVVLHGEEVEIMSPQGAATQQADARAFAAPVPPELTKYLQAHHQSLYPKLRDLWDLNGDKLSGSWAQVFGDTTRADEIFMAWHYARFIHAVTARGKAAYNLPMYVNTWLAGETTPPGEFPSGGPEPWVVDVWKAAGGSLDFYSPDLYDPLFEQWCQRYHRDGNPLYMPETRGQAAGAANVFYALGEEAGFGFSPFAIESEASETDPLGDSYKAIASIAPLLAQHQAAGDVHGFVLGPGHPSEVDFTLSGYTLHVALDNSFGGPASAAFGLIMATGKDEFLGVGKGFRVTFTPRSVTGPKAGIAAVDEGTFEDGKWVPERRLIGDEDDQGVHWRFDPKQIHIEKVSLYHYE